MPDVVISEYIDDAALEALRARFEVHYDDGLVDRPYDLAGALAGAQALIVRNRTRVTADLLDAGTALRVVGRLGVGLDNIDLAACRARGIEVAPATGANTVSVAEYAIAAVLMLLRGAYHCSAEVAAGDWPRAHHVNGLECAGKTLGLVGFNHTGRAVAPRAAALGMTVIACDPYVDASDPAWSSLGVERVPLDVLLERSHAVSLHVPLTDETRHLVGAAQLARMPAGAVLVNSARGGVVDERALASALRSGHLRGAMLDVFEDEPLPAGSPLAGVPGLVLTPHIAGLTVESNARVGGVVAARVAEVLTGAAS